MIGDGDLLTVTLILSIDWTSGKNNPVKPRSVAVENGPLAASPLPSKRKPEERGLALT